MTDMKVETIRPTSREHGPTLNWPLFQHRLKEMRERAELTQVEIDQQIGMNNAYYSGWERGQATPNVLDWLFRLSILFDTTTDYLLGRTTYPDVSPRARYRTIEATQVAEIVDKLPEDFRQRVLAFAKTEESVAADLQARDERLGATLRRLIRLVDLVDGEMSASAKPIFAELAELLDEETSAS